MKVIKALKPLTIESVNENVIRGQYVASNGMNGYLEEVDVPKDSFTETYVAIKAEIENERWKGVPFYLRTGDGGQSSGNRVELPSAAKPYFRQ